MKNLVLELEDRALELEEQNEILRVKLEACEQDREQAVSQLQDLAKDKRDLLSLLDVMSASPIGIRNILHSFLEKVGEDAQNPKLMFGINQDGEQISMAERIAEALQIKREQEKAVSGILVSPLSSPDKDSNVYSGFNSPDISPNHHSSTSKSSIGITDENRDHPFGPSEGERNNLRNMNPILADKTLYNSSRQSSPNPKRENRDKARENFLTRATTSNANIESADRKTPSDAMTDQYSLARKLRQHQLAEAKLTNQLAKANLQIQQQMTDEILYDTIQRHKEATSSRVGSRSNSPLPVVADWIECYDPRTKRKYYHSPSLHKSTWVNPYNSNPNGDSNSNRLPSRYNSPASTRGNISYSSSPNPRKVSDLYLKAKEDNAFSSSLGK